MKKWIVLFQLLIVLAGCGSDSPASSVADVYYTCSMDPQVISERPGKCPICKMELTPVQKVRTTEADGLQLSDQQIQLGNIKTDTVHTGEFNNSLVLTGTLNFDQSKRTSLSARVMGRIERLYYKNTGDYVAKGTPVYELYSEELNTAKQEYILVLERRQLFTNQSVIDFDALLQSARHKLRLWGMTDAQIKALAQAKSPSLTTTFYSPASGYITQLNATEGAYVMEGGTILQLVDLSSLWAEAQVYSSQVSNIGVSQKATVTVPGAGVEAIEGRIAFANPELNPQSRIHLVRVPIANPGSRLKPGMPAYIKLQANRVEVLTLPADAVIREANSAVVWIATAPNTFTSKTVTLGAESNSQIEITSGLKEGDVVVTGGAYLLHSEAILKRGANAATGHSH